MQSYFYSGDRNAKGGSGFFLIQFLEITQDQNFAINWRKGLDSGAKFFADFFFLESFGGDFAPVSEEGGGEVAVVIFGGKVEGIFCGSFGFAQTAAAFVHGDGDEPGAEFGLAAEAGEMTEGVDEGFLGSVFGFLFVADHGVDGDVDHFFVGADEVVEELGFAGEDAADESGFVGGCCNGGRHCWSHGVLDGHTRRTRIIGVLGVEEVTGKLDREEVLGSLDRACVAALP